MSGEFEHVPVLSREVMEYLVFPDAPARLIDGTVGGGGHSSQLLKRYPRLELLGIDRDDAALEKAAETLAFAKERVTLVDGILLDIGVSSPQLDQPERGFSWRAEGPLDMRMDRREALTASRFLNRGSEEELTRVFREYGELPAARRLAAAVVARREEKPFATTSDLVKLCDDVLGKSKRGQLPSPTLVFQALRIFVNDELGELERALPEAVEMLRTGGRIAVISFHSLEDRIVKNFFRDAAAECTCPPGLPVCVCGATPSLRVLTRKVVTARPDELESNRRSAPARLRAAEKIAVKTIR